jgi:uncharacterized protein (TIGR00251 family)
MNTATLMIRVSPRAGRTELTGRRGDAWHVRLAAAPVDGAANAALIEFIADTLDWPRRQVAIVSGEKSRDKRLEVRGLSEVEVVRRMTAAGR